MKKSIFYLMILLCILCMSCSTENNDNENTDNIMYNRQIIEYLQHKYDVTADVEFNSEYNKRMSKDDVEDFESYFRFLGNLKKHPLQLKMSKYDHLTRARETKSFSQTFDYEGNDVAVYVYYDVDETGRMASPVSVVVGMGGHGESFYFRNAIYEVIDFGASYNVNSTSINVEKVRADYIVRNYNIINGKHGDTVMSIAKTKLAAYGYVNVLNHTGNFQLMYCGSGSWRQTIIDEELKKEIEP